MSGVSSNHNVHVCDFYFFYQKYVVASMIAVCHKDIFVKYCSNVITYT